MKIDTSFVSGMTHQREDHAIVVSVAHFATHLGLWCTAEGVERMVARPPDRAGAWAAHVSVLAKSERPGRAHEWGRPGRRGYATPKTKGEVRPGRSGPAS